MSFWKNLFKKQHLTLIRKIFLLNDKNSLIAVFGGHLDFSHSLNYNRNNETKFAPSLAYPYYQFNSLGSIKFDLFDHSFASHLVIFVWPQFYHILIADYTRKSYIDVGFLRFVFRLSCRRSQRIENFCNKL